MNPDPPLLVIGDIHGNLDKLIRHLRYAGLATSDARWTGGDAQLWFMGDFTDRGPDGVGAIDFIMRLQQDAANQGGQVGSLLGNHDVAILSAKLFPNRRTRGPEGTFFQDWIAYGGMAADLPKMETHHIDWLLSLPAMAVVQNRLLLHADAMFYLNYGETLTQVNDATTAMLHSDETDAWEKLLEFSGERLQFDERHPGGVMRAAQMLAYFGGKQIIHGHTPIPMLSREPLAHISRAYEYCEGLAVDVDGWMYKGGTGFVYEAPPLNGQHLTSHAAHISS